MLIPTLIGVVFIVFLILALIPGDPGRIQLGISATQEAVDALNHQWGLDRPFFVRFADFVVGAVTRFDFGRSYRSNESVVTEIVRRLPITAGIAFYGVLTVLVLGVPLGILSATRRATFIDTSVTVYAMFLSAIPTFWFALLLLYLFSLVLGLLPTHGVESWRGYILPIAAMAIPASSGFIRLTRVTMLDVVYQEYIKTARAKGAHELSVIWKHAFKNAMLPIINGAGLMFSSLLGGTVIIETIFTIPGVGRLLVTAIQQRDMPVVMGCTIFLAAIFMLIVLLVDIIYAALDPRIRARFSS
ncbi:peptide ABC transporter permease [Clostridia bacterium]|nr:peptide ABC transporter permease [Clostridia bacterium]